MASAPPVTAASIASNFLDALRRAVLALRQHGTAHALAQEALQQLLRRAAALPPAAPIELAVQPPLARCGGEVVHREGQPLLLQPLQALGIGAVVLVPGQSADALRQLALGLAAGADDLVARLRQAEPQAPRLLPAAVGAAAPPPPASALAWLPPPPAEATGRAAAAREAALNLPVRAARMLLADLGDSTSAAPLLLRLCAAIAARGDLAGTALIDELAAHHPALPANVQQALRGEALSLLRASLPVERLRRLDREALQHLAGLSLQLGGGAVAELLGACAAAGVQLPGCLLQALNACR